MCEGGYFYHVTSMEVRYHLRVVVDQGIPAAPLYLGRRQLPVIVSMTVCYHPVANVPYFNRRPLNFRRFTTELRVLGTPRKLRDVWFDTGWFFIIR